MYIEELTTIECTLKLSCYDPKTKALLDFDAVFLDNPSAKAKIDTFLSSKKVSHYIVVENIEYDKKSIDFSSPTVENTLYATLKNGKTYRWRNAAVSFIRVGSDTQATFIVSKAFASPYNRRDTFRIPVDCDGFVFFGDKESPVKCVVRDVSHDGIGISLDELNIKLLRGLPARITWEETAHFDSSDRKTTRKFSVEAEVVRRKTGLDGTVNVGFHMKKEPDAIRDYIQWAQTHRSVIGDNSNSNRSGVKSSASKKAKDPDEIKGVKKTYNYELEKQLKQMSGE